MKKTLTKIQEIFKFKQASKQASKQRKGGKLLFNLSSKELLGGGYRLAIFKVAL